MQEKGAPVTHTTAAPAGSTAAVPAATPNKKATGLSFRRFFTKPGVSPYDEVEWELRTAAITDAQGNIIFEQKDVEVPKDWSMTATNIVARKYLHGTLGTPSAKPAFANWLAAWPRPFATGAWRRAISRRRKTARRSMMNSSIFLCGSMLRSIRRSGSMLAATALSQL